jgi:hypothetical protein
MNPQDCKFYQKCSVNVCPLDELKDKRIISPLDKQKTCRLQKEQAKNVSNQ